MRDLERVRYIASNYHLLQGLKWVLWGMWLLLGAGWWRWYEVWEPISGLLALVPVVLMFWLIDIYYRRNFGWADPRPTSQTQLAGLVFLGAAMFVTGFIDGTVRPSVSIFGLTVAAMMFAYFWMTVGLKFHRVAMVITVAASGFLPLSGLTSYEQSTILSIVLGASFIFIGVVDHVLLARAMNPIPEEGPNAVR